VKSFEPRVAVSGWKPGRWSAAGRSLDESLCTGVQSWVYAFGGDYIGHRDLARRDLDAYDILIVNTNKPLAPLAQLARDRPASLKWVSLIEGNADDYCVPQEHLRALLDASDLVDTINRRSLPLFRRLTTSRVEQIGMPYPVEGVRRFATPLARRKPRAFLCTQLSRRWNEHLVARELGLGCFGHDLRTSRDEGLLPLITRAIKARSFAVDREENAGKMRRLYGDDALGFMTFTKDAGSYLAESGNSLLWLDLDDRHTWARFVLDAAALGVPIIATASTGHGETLFPLTTVADFMDIERAVEIGRRLIGDRAFYEHVATFPAQGLEAFKAEPMKRALLGALGVS
jgi:hypothetical protein